jgi:hypothetical protein
MATAKKGVFSVRSLKRAAPDVAARVKAQVGIATAPAAAPGIAAEARAPTLAPGVERWPVKTGTDPDVGEVNLSSVVVSTTVDEMVRANRPNDMADPNLDYPAYQAHRATPLESTVWTLDCQITAAKLEADGDYHLVLQSPSGETMIGEVPDPDPRFVNPSSPFLADIQVVRQAVDKRIFSKLLNTPLALEATGKYMVPATSFKVAPKKTTTIAAARKRGKLPPTSTPFPVKTAITPVKARLTGVGFFDRKHGQLGVAPNGVELHPVLDIKFL